MMVFEDDFPFPGVYSQVPCESSRVYFGLLSNANGVAAPLRKTRWMGLTGWIPKNVYPTSSGKISRKKNRTPVG